MHEHHRACESALSHACNLYCTQFSNLLYLYLITSSSSSPLILTLRKTFYSSCRSNFERFELSGAHGEHSALIQMAHPNERTNRWKHASCQHYLFEIVFFSLSIISHASTISQHTLEFMTNHKRNAGKNVRNERAIIYILLGFLFSSLFSVHFSFCIVTLVSCTHALACKMTETSRHSVRNDTSDKRRYLFVAFEMKREEKTPIENYNLMNFFCVAAFSAHLFSRSRTLRMLSNELRIYSLVLRDHSSEWHGENSWHNLCLFLTLIYAIKSQKRMLAMETRRLERIANINLQLRFEFTGQYFPRVEVRDSLMLTNTFCE